VWSLACNRLSGNGLHGRCLISSDTLDRSRVAALCAVALVAIDPSVAMVVEEDVVAVVRKLDVDDDRDGEGTSVYALAVALACGAAMLGRRTGCCVMSCGRELECVVAAPLWAQMEEVVVAVLDFGPAKGKVKPFDIVRVLMEGKKEAMMPAAEGTRKRKRLGGGAERRERRNKVFGCTDHCKSTLSSVNQAHNTASCG